MNIQAQLPTTQSTFQAQEWHRGTGIDVKGLTLDEQLKAAKLDWTVELSPFRYGEQLQYTDDKRVAAYRSSDGRFIDLYQDRKPWQNYEILSSFYEFLEISNLDIDRIGTLDNGFSIYATARLPITTDVRKVGDIIDWRLVLRDGHRNGTGLKVSLFANRLVCSNGMHIFVRQYSQKIAHLGSFNKEKINNLLNQANQILRNEENIYERLANTPVSTEEAVMHLISLYGDPSKKVEDQPKPVQTALRLFEGLAKGSHYLGAYQTAWGLLNAVSEYFNWHAPSRRNSATQLNSLLEGGRHQGIQRMKNQLVQCYLSN